MRGGRGAEEEEEEDVSISEGFALSLVFPTASLHPAQGEWEGSDQRCMQHGEGWHDAESASENLPHGGLPSPHPSTCVEGFPPTKLLLVADAGTRCGVLHTSDGWTDQRTGKDMRLVEAPDFPSFLDHICATSAVDFTHLPDANVACAFRKGVPDAWRLLDVLEKNRDHSQGDFHIPDVSADVEGATELLTAMARAYLRDVLFPDMPDFAAIPSAAGNRMATAGIHTPTCAAGPVPPFPSAAQAVLRCLFELSPDVAAGVVATGSRVVLTQQDEGGAEFLLGPVGTILRGGREECVLGHVSTLGEATCVMRERAGQRAWGGARPHPIPEPDACRLVMYGDKIDVAFDTGGVAGITFGDRGSLGPVPVNCFTCLRPGWRPLQRVRVHVAGFFREGDSLKPLRQVLACIARDCGLTEEVETARQEELVMGGASSAMASFLPSFQEGAVAFQLQVVRAFDHGGALLASLREKAMERERRRVAGVREAWRVEEVAAMRECLIFGQSDLGVKAQRRGRDGADSCGDVGERRRIKMEVCRLQGKKHIRVEMEVQEPARKVQRVTVRELLAMKQDVDAATAGKAMTAGEAVTAGAGRGGEVREGGGKERSAAIQPVWSDAAAEVAVMGAGQREVVSCHLLPAGGHVVVTRDLQAGRLVVSAGKADVLVLNKEVEGVCVDVASSLLLAHSSSMECIQLYQANQAFTQVS